MKDISKYYQEKSEWHLLVASSFPILVQLKKEEDKTSFFKELENTLPEVKKYINVKLKTALKKGQIPRGKYEVNEFIDQLFIEVYDHFNEVKNEKEFRPWLFKKADDLLDDAMVDEEFDALFFKNIDEYSKQEWDEMEEKYIVDADGDFVMEEDLEDISYYTKPYSLKDVFVDTTEEEMTEKLDKKLNEEQINRHIELVLHKMSEPMRTTFQLFVDHRFEPKEIAKIKNISNKEVELFLDDARRDLKRSISKRFLIDDKS